MENSNVSKQIAQLYINMISESVNKNSPIAKEYAELMELPIKELRAMMRYASKGVDVSKYKSKEHLVTDILKSKHGDKKVADAMGVDESYELDESIKSRIIDGLMKFANASDDDFKEMIQVGVNAFKKKAEEAMKNVPDEHKALMRSEIKAMSNTLSTAKTLTEFEKIGKQETKKLVNRLKSLNVNKESYDLDESDTSYDSDLNPNKKIIIKGVKGMKSTPFVKKFRNMQAAEKWMESDDAGNYEIYEIMNESYDKKENLIEMIKGVLLEDLSNFTNHGIPAEFAKNILRKFTIDHNTQILPIAGKPKNSDIKDNSLIINLLPNGNVITVLKRKEYPSFSAPYNEYYRLELINNQFKSTRTTKIDDAVKGMSTRGKFFHISSPSLQYYGKRDKKPTPDEIKNRSTHDPLAGSSWDIYNYMNMTFMPKMRQEMEAMVDDIYANLRKLSNERSYDRSRSQQNQALEAVATIEKIAKEGFTESSMEKFLNTFGKKHSGFASTPRNESELSRLLKNEPNARAKWAKIILRTAREQHDAVKSMISTPFVEKFRNMQAAEKWMESDDAGNYEIMNESYYEEENLIEMIKRGRKKQVQAPVVRKAKPDYSKLTDHGIPVAFAREIVEMFKISNKRLDVLPVAGRLNKSDIYYKIDDDGEDLLINLMSNGNVLAVLKNKGGDFYYRLELINNLFKYTRKTDINAAIAGIDLNGEFFYMRVTYHP